MDMKEKIFKSAVECRIAYSRISEIAEELEGVRRKLYVNSFHKQNVDEDFEDIDRILFNLQSEIRYLYDNYLNNEEEF